MGLRLPSMHPWWWLLKSGINSQMMDAPGLLRYPVYKELVRWRRRTDIDKSNNREPPICSWRRALISRPSAKLKYLRQSWNISSALRLERDWELAVALTRSASPNDEPHCLSQTNCRDNGNCFHFCRCPRKWGADQEAERKIAKYGSKFGSRILFSMRAR